MAADTEGDPPLLHGLAADGALRLAFAAFAANGALYGSVLSRYAEIADTVGATEGTFGAAVAAGAVGGLVGAALAPMLLRRSGPVRAVVATGCLYSLLAIGVAGSPTVVLLSVALFAMGVVDGGQDVSMNSLTVSLQQRRTGSLMGRAHATWSLALTAGAGLGALAATAGIPVVVHITLVAVVFAALQLHSGAVARARSSLDDPPPPEEEGHPDAEGALDRGPGQRRSVQQGPPRPRSAPKVRIRIAALVLAAVAASYIEGPGQDWTALVLGRGLDASPGLAASGPLAFSGGLLLARLLLDAVTARISKTFISMASAAIVTLSMVVAFVTTLDGTGSGLALVAIGLAGFGAGPIYPMLFNAAEMLSTHYGVAPSTTAAVISTCSRVGAISAPVAVGALAGSSGLFTVFIIMAAGGLVLLVSLPTALR